MNNIISLNITIRKGECKYCNSRNIVKYGFYNNIQRWWCKDCHRKFADNDALPGMKVSENQVGTAVTAYYSGMPIREIGRVMISKYGLYISSSTIYNWIDKMSLLATSINQKHHPKVGNTWIANRTKIRIMGTCYYCVDLIDFKTKFLIATTVTGNLNDLVIRKLINSAINRVDKIPQNIIVFRSKILKDLLAAEYQSYNRYIQIILFKEDEYREFLELFKSSFNIRNKIFSKLKKIEHIKIIMDGWVVHYNYRRVHELLEGKTPAEKAGINLFSNI